MIARTPSMQLWVACVAVASLALGASARADAPYLETLDPKTAFEELAKSEGPVFVDLYAEW